MAVDERHRLQLADAAKRVLGDEAGITLMELLPPVGWADVATKQDLELVRRDIARLEARFDEFEERLELRFDAKFERGFRQILVTMTSLMVAGMATTVAVAFAR
jgi:hypothetical protein